MTALRPHDSRSSPCPVKSGVRHSSAYSQFTRRPPCSCKLTWFGGALPPPLAHFAIPLPFYWMVPDQGIAAAGASTRRGQCIRPLAANARRRRPRVRCQFLDGLPLEKRLPPLRVVHPLAIDMRDEPLRVNRPDLAGQDAEDSQVHLRVERAVVAAVVEVDSHDYAALLRSFLTRFFSTAAKRSVCTRLGRTVASL